MLWSLAAGRHYLKLEPLQSKQDAKDSCRRVEKELPMASWIDLDTARSVIRGLAAEDRVHRRVRFSWIGNPEERWKTAFRIACSTFPSASYRHPTERFVKTNALTTGSYVDGNVSSSVGWR